MPLRQVVLVTIAALAPEGVNGDGEETWMLVRLLDLDRVQVCVHAHVSSEPTLEVYSSKAGRTARKGILLWSSSMIRNLYPALLLQWVVVQVYVGSLVEAVVWRLLRGRADEVMDVGKAGTPLSGLLKPLLLLTDTHSVKRDTSPGCGGMVIGDDDYVLQAQPS